MHCTLFAVSNFTLFPTPYHPLTPRPPLPPAEHHMYANVPCYHLAELHEAIKHDLPPTPNGLAEVWSVIITALDKTAVDRDYKCPIVLPEKKAS